MNKQELTFFEVDGFCMWPFLKPSQKILVKKTTGADLLPGDLMLYRCDGCLHCHRLSRKEKKDGHWVFHCRPDASGYDGEPVDENALEGKVAAVITQRKIVDLETPWARCRAFMILLFLAPLLAYLDRLYKKVKGI